jgi:hypothetical protein
MSISSMKTSTPFLNSSAKIMFIKLWKVAGALVSPNGITRNSNKPLCVLKVVLYYSLAAIQIWWYLDLKSSLVKYLALGSSSNNSSTTCIGCLCLTVIAFKCLQSTQNLHVSSFFLTSKSGESPSLVLDNWWNLGTNHYAKCVDMKW